MRNNPISRYDKPLAIAFTILSALFIIIAFANDEFFSWVFERHQNLLSWYIRPIFLIPFCYFAYRRSWAGITGTVFLLLTSMFWFPAPGAVSEDVRVFLEMEKEYLAGEWGWSKILLTLLVPVSLSALAASFWKHSLWLGVSVLIAIAIAKMLWSVVFGGESGISVILPAVIGLAICVIVIFIGFRGAGKRKRR